MFSNKVLILSLTFLLDSFIELSKKVNFLCVYISCIKPAKSHNYKREVVQCQHIKIKKRVDGIANLFMKIGVGKRSKKKKMGFRLQKEAKEYEIDFIARHSKTCDMRFSLFVDLYFEDCKPRLRPTTLNGKRYIINEHILPYFGQLKLNKITPVTVRNWQTKLMNHPNNYKETYLKTIHNRWCRWASGSGRRGRG